VSPAFLILSLPVFLFSIVVHESAHGLAALANGDRTAKNAGRITLNPLPHVDLFGSLIVPFVFLLSQGFKPNFLIGWAKPVPVNPSNFQHGKRSEIEVSLAGPVSNLTLAFAFAVISRFLPAWNSGSNFLLIIRYMLVYGMHINCLLAVFNLIPVPPLDGSHVLSAILPEDAAFEYRKISSYGMWILIGVLLFPPLRRIVLDFPVAVLRNFFENIAGTYMTM